MARSMELDMTNRLQLLLLATIFMVWGAALVHGAEETLSMIITSSDNGVSQGSAVYKSGSPVFLLVTLKNNSTKTLSVPSFDQTYYTIDVRDDRGNRVAEAEEARSRHVAADSPTNLLHGRTVGNGINGEVKPRATWKAAIEVSALWDMTRPGKYTIQVQRELPDEIGKGVVKSNTINVTVTP